MANFINLTPHDVSILRTDGTTRIFPRENREIPRLSQSTKQVAEIEGILITETHFGETVHLPEPMPNTFFIVSRLVLSANPHRTDLLVPEQMIRDYCGNIVGCMSFAHN